MTKIYLILSLNPPPLKKGPVSLLPFFSLLFSSSSPSPFSSSLLPSPAPGLSYGARRFHALGGRAGAGGPQSRPLSRSHAPRACARACLPGPLSFFFAHLSPRAFAPAARACVAAAAVRHPSRRRRGPRGPAPAGPAGAGGSKRRRLHAARPGGRGEGGGEERGGRRPVGARANARARALAGEGQRAAAALARLFGRGGAALRPGRGREGERGRMGRWWREMRGGGES